MFTSSPLCSLPCFRLTRTFPHTLAGDFREPLSPEQCADTSQFQLDELLTHTNILLHVDVLDADRFSKDMFLGQIVLPLQLLPIGTPVAKWYPLGRRSSKDKVCCRVCCVPLAVVSTVHSSVGPAHSRTFVHRSGETSACSVCWCHQSPLWPRNSTSRSPAHPVIPSPPQQEGAAEAVGKGEAALRSSHVQSQCGQSGLKARRAACRRRRTERARKSRRHSSERSPGGRGWSRRRSAWITPKCSPKRYPGSPRWVSVRLLRFCTFLCKILNNVLLKLTMTGPGY